MGQSNFDPHDENLTTRAGGATGTAHPSGVTDESRGSTELTEPNVEQSEVIELTIPATPDRLVLARLVTGAVASRIGFDVEEIDDLKLAVDELCLSSVGAVSTGTLHLRFAAGAEDIQISCTFEPALATLTDADALGVGPEGAEGMAAFPPDADLSERILEALVDEYGRNGNGAGATAWLTKRLMNADPDSDAL
jgi:serine/threonine-protein kinase RsbW